MPKSSRQVRVNITSRVNNKKIRREKRDGRSVIIVPSATLPDDVVMNGIRYPADEIASSFETLEDTPAPLGHPAVNGVYVSARSPAGINRGWVGAHNENVRQEGGRVLLDKVIDVEVANRSADGKRLLKAIEDEDPIHTSTGVLIANLEVASKDDTAEHVARDMFFDHDAILLDEQGAATPDQGVGMMVNGQQIEVITSSLDHIEDQLDWAGMSMLRALEENERASLWERIKPALLEAFGKAMGTERGETPVQNEETTMADEDLKALTAKMNALEEQLKAVPTVEQLTELFGNQLKPVTETIAEMQANAKKAEEAQRVELINKLTKAGVREEDECKQLDLPTLTKLVGNMDSGKTAAGVGQGAGGGDADEWADTDLNANLQTEKAA